MLMFKVAFSLFCSINQSTCRYSCLCVEQPIRFRMSVVYASLGNSNTRTDNSNVNMPYCKNSFFPTSDFYQIKNKSSCQTLACCIKWYCITLQQGKCGHIMLFWQNEMKSRAPGSLMSNFENYWYRPRIQFVMAFVSWCKAIYQCGIACLCDQSKLQPYCRQ